MNAIVHDVEQRSPEWHALRLGRVCASKAADMLAVRPSDGKPAAGRNNLRVQLVLERVTGRSQERNVQTQAMLDGVEREDAALALYQAETGSLLQKVGFVSHPELMAGASPDGVLGSWERFVEVKAPIPATHLETLRTSRVPDDYLKQMLHLAWLTDMRAGDFVSYQPDFPDVLRLKILPVTFTPAQLDEHGAKVRIFLKEVDLETDAIRTMANLKGQLQAALA